MTEFELVDAAVSYQSLMHSWVSTYFTAISAYLLTAYFIGSNLTTFQTWVISVCFIVFSFLTAYAAWGTGSRMFEFVQEIHAINPDRNFAMNLYALTITTTILFIGIVVALKFMWDVRHPKE